MRLTIALKKEMVRKALELAGVGRREQELVAKRAAWADAVRLDALGGKQGEELVKQTELRVKELLHTLPNGVWDCSPVINKDSYIVVNVAGRAVYAYFNGYFRRHSGSILKITVGRTTLLPESPLVAVFEGLVAEEKSIDADKDAIEAKVFGSLSSINTVKQLLKVWPEAVELLPPTVAASDKPGLPAVPTTELNKLLHLPSKKDKIEK